MLLTPYQLYYTIALVSGRAPSLNGRAYALLGPAVETPLLLEYNSYSPIMLITHTIFSSIRYNVMPWPWVQVGPEGINLYICSHLHAQESGIYQCMHDVDSGPELCQSGTALTFPVLCLLDLSLRSMVQCERLRMRMHDFHYLTCSKFNSPHWNDHAPHKHTYKYIYI